MVQSKGEEAKVMVNGDAAVKKEENGEIITNENASLDGDESDDDDYLDYLLMVPPTDECSEDRNKSLVSRTLMDLCTAIESRKEYPKIRQELLMQCSNSVPKQEVEEVAEEPMEQPLVVVEEKKEEEDNLVKIEEETIMAEPEPEPATIAMNGHSSDSSKDEPTSTGDEEDERGPGGRRQSVRLEKAQFVPSDNEPTINDQFFVCRRCTIFFKTKELRKLHNLAHHRRKDVVVDNKEAPKAEEEAPIVAEATATTEVAVERDKTAEKPSQKTRLRRSSTLDPFVCDLCPKVFKQKPLLRSHMNCHMTEPQFFCKQCSYASKRNADVKKHYETHHDPDSGKFLKRKRKCDHCSEILNGKKAFLLHMRSSHAEALKKLRGGITRKCEQCPEVFNSIKMFRIHMKKSHQAPVKDIRCEKCNRRFKTNFRLRKHVAKYVALGSECKIQTPAKPPTSAAAVVVAAVPISKQNGHSPESKKTPFVCEHCEKKFTLKSHLSLHMKKHQSLTCKKCNTVFKSKFNLKWHEFSHLEIEPKCPQCLRSFTSESSYAVHLKKNNCTMTNGNH